VLITGIAQGGQLMTTTEVDNWPADADGVQGPDLMARFQKHAERFGTEMIFDHIHTTHFWPKSRSAWSATAGEYTCDALIIATGASAKYLGLPSEEKFAGKGVSACATCDGFFYRNQEVAVIGGGNTAVEEALYLANIASQVTLVHRRDKFKAEKIMVDKLSWRRSPPARSSSRSNARWTKCWATSHRRHRHAHQAREDRRHQRHRLQGVFIAIGHKPNTDIFEGQLEMEGGYIVTQGGRNGNATATSVPGVFAAGDVQDHIYRQAMTSAGTGCMAALDAERVAPIRDTGRADLGQRTAHRKIPHRPATAEAPVKTAPALTLPVDLNDPQALFRHVVGNAAPLPDRNLATLEKPPPPPRPIQREKDEAEALKESIDAPLSFQDRLDIGDESVHLHEGIPRRVLTDLRRGRWVIQDELDLHGLTRDEARATLSAFLAHALKQDFRCVRLIHGKGLGSPGREPVLKHLSRGWLMQRSEILAFCQARPHDGGEGALLILLRNQKKTA
jgi:thioredoxin reductase (NADPH)